MSVACHGVLDVSDPTRVQDSDIANPAGVNARRLYAAFNFFGAAGRSAADVALFTDEESIDGRPGYDHGPLNRRDGAGYDAYYTNVGGLSYEDPHLGVWDNVVTAADIAIPTIHAYTPDSLKGDFLAHMFGVSGYAIVQMAEDVCPGFPINHVSPENRAVFGPGFTTDSALKYGIAELDSALHYVHDSTQFRYLAQVARGRALLDLGQYAAAAAAVDGVPTTFAYLTEGNNNNNYQDPSRYDYSYDNVVVSDSEGGNGLPFISAHDPRVTSVAVGPSYVNSPDSAYFATKYTDYSDPLVVASGIEARLIEAEAALHEPNPTKAFAILDTLRATVGLGALTIPSTLDAQVDTLYKERAFWLYLTGRRLGDLRRLIRNYGRNPETVFPTGAVLGGGEYGSSTAIPFVFATEKSQNPYLTSGCTSP